MDGLVVLDLYAGTGALAIEALSRGAAAAVLVERDRAALAAIAANLQVLPSETAVGVPVDVVARDVGRFLAGAPPPDAPFDLVFVDPPYDTPDEEVTDLLATLLEPGWLARGAIVSVERPRRHPVVLRVEEQRPNNISMLYQIGSIYGDKLGGAAENSYYKRRVREETRPHPLRH